MANDYAQNFNDLECHPEIKRYILVNNFSDDENIVTEFNLKNAFTESDIMKIKSGRHTGFTLFDYYD